MGGSTSAAKGEHVGKRVGIEGDAPDVRYSNDAKRVVSLRNPTEVIIL